MGDHSPEIIFFLRSLPTLQGHKALSHRKWGESDSHLKSVSAAARKVSACTVVSQDTLSSNVHQKGSNINIMDENLAQQLGIDRIPLPDSTAANALDGHKLGTVTHQTAPIHMAMAGNHHETVQFHILPSPRHPLIPGYPWLLPHNPHIHWTMGTILGWSTSCHQICLKQATTPPSTVSPNLNEITIKNQYPHPHLLSNLFKTQSFSPN